MGRADHQRISAIQRLKKRPELAPACIHQTLADKELVFQNRQRAVSLTLHRQASATV